MTVTHCLSVLIVEDDPDGADSLAELLGLYGHQVRVARSVAGALAALADGTPGAVLLDIELPDGDGYELARRVRERLGPQPLLVAVTGHPNMDGWSRLEGVDHHLLKPVASAHLTDLLTRHAERLAGSERSG